jgi:small nuclear ribonucleoprotein (snRNP)-like protein
LLHALLHLLHATPPHTPTRPPPHPDFPLQESRLKHEALRARALALQQRILDANPPVTLQSIMDCVQEGPLRALAAWAAQGRRVRVVTRHAAGVRGAATGLVRCFDRLMNVLLEDVVEVYTVVLKVARSRPKGQPGQVGLQQPGGEGAGRQEALQQVGAADGGPQQRQQVRWCRKQERRQRQLAQIFIKGDNVVCISAVQLEAQQQQQQQQQRQPP